MEIVNLGTVFENGFVRHPGFYCQGPAHSPGIFLGNTVPGLEIPWIKVGDMYIAKRNVCTHISWDALNSLGYIFGVPVYIDGQQYICRSLRVGSNGNPDNEWNTLLNQYGEDNRIWNCEYDQFWGQETVGNSDSIVRGRGAASARGIQNAACTYDNVGFRPVLEPLPPAAALSTAMVGSKVRLYGPRGFVEGRFLSCDGKAIVLSGASTTSDLSWIMRKRDCIVADRGCIMLATNLEAKHLDLIRLPKHHAWTERTVDTYKVVA